MGLAAAFDEIVDSLPDDWTDLSLDLRLADEERYVDAAVMLTHVGYRTGLMYDMAGVTARAHEAGALFQGRLALADQRRPSVRPCRRSRDRARHVRPGRRRGDRGRDDRPGSARGSCRGRPDVGTPGERPAGLPPPPLALAARGTSRHRGRPVPGVTDIDPDIRGQDHSRPRKAWKCRVDIGRLVGDAVLGVPPRPCVQGVLVELTGR